MTTKEHRKLRNEKVRAARVALAKRLKRKPKRKRGVRPPGAKEMAIPASKVPGLEKAEKPSGTK